MSSLYCTMTRTPPDFFQMTTSRLDYGEVECRTKSAPSYWSKVASTSLAVMELMRCGRGLTGAIPSGPEIPNGITKQEPESDLGLRKLVTK